MNKKLIAMVGMTALAAVPVATLAASASGSINGPVVFQTIKGGVTFVTFTDVTPGAVYNCQLLAAPSKTSTSGSSSSSGTSLGISSTGGGVVNGNTDNSHITYVPAGTDMLPFDFMPSNSANWASKKVGMLNAYGDGQAGIIQCTKSSSSAPSGTSGTPSS